MDFIGIIRSLEELLYEVMGWLLFYPRTLWRILVRPDETTRYSEDEQDDQGAERYSETLSPPLLLMITLVLTHVVGVSIGMEAPRATGAVGEALVGSPQHLLTVRALIFAIIPLVIASISPRRRRIPIDRKTLRMPFYSQCFLLTPFALMVEGALLITRSPDPGGAVAAALGIAAFGWFLWAQTRWFARRLHLSPIPALVTAGMSIGAALVAALLTAVLIALVI